MNIALVAHDHQKKDMAEWVAYNYQTLAKHHLICTGTTGRIVEDSITAMAKSHGLDLTLDLQKLSSGPLGGDQQLGALITEGKVDLMIFWWDPMQPQPHDVDVKALLRLSVLYNLPSACNRATADFLISSPLFASGYVKKPVDFSGYVNRIV
jgi:methylglyoxal synthase